MKTLLLLVTVLVVASWTKAHAQPGHAVQLNTGETYYVVTGAAGGTTTIIDTLGGAGGQLVKSRGPITGGQVFRGLADGRVEPLALGSMQFLMGTPSGTRVVQLVAGNHASLTYVPAATPGDIDQVVVSSDPGSATIYVPIEYTLEGSYPTPGCGGGDPPYTLVIPENGTYFRVSDPGNVFGNHNVNNIVCATGPCQIGRFVFFETKGNDITWGTNPCGGGNLISSTFNTDNDDVIMLVYSGDHWIRIAFANN